MIIAIVDYGVGNLRSVQRALDISGADDIRLVSSPEEIEKADKLILPGVGSFNKGMEGLNSAGLTEALQSFASSGKSVLGICLGAQLLVTSGEEFGTSKGLNLIPGFVTKIRWKELDHQKRLPVIGWTTLNMKQKNNHVKGSCLQNTRDTDAVYLLHSYHINLVNSDNLLATYDYHGATVTAAIKHENITGLQFHPEKSGPVGLNILKQFLKE